MAIKQCKCGSNNYQWCLDDKLQSWIKCADCGTNLFADDIGVILINWKATNTDDFDIVDVLRSNVNNDGIVSNQERQ